jgi:NitT/TauT family transport system substrate-binding protein
MGRHKHLILSLFSSQMSIESKKLIVVVVISAAAVAGIGTALSLFFMQHDSTSNPTTTTTTTISTSRPIRIAFSPWVGNAALVLAADELRKNNVPVEFVVTDNVTKAEEMYVNGQVDGLSSLYTNTIFQNSEGVNSKLVWVFDYSGTADAIVGPQNTTIADLKGKKISFEGLNTFSHIFVLQALARAGLYEKDVQFENIPGQDVLKALNGKEINAGHTWGPTKFEALQSGYSILTTAKDVGGIITDVLIFNSRVVESRPGDIQATIESMSQGKEYLDNNKENSSQILAQFYNMSREEVQDGFEGIQILGLEDNVEAMNKSLASSDMTSLYRSGGTIANYLLDRGQIREIPDFDEIIDPRFVDAIYEKKNSGSSNSSRIPISTNNNNS